MISLHLPYPPTANTIWIRARKGMRRSEGYMSWLEKAGWEVKQQRPSKVAGPYALSLIATRPDKRKRDLDNLLKPVSDLLVKMGIVADDSLCESISARWVTGEPGVQVTVEAMKTE